VEQHLLESALNAAYNGITVIDHEARVIYCNDAASEMIGTPKDQIIGRKIKEINPHTGLDKVLKDGKTSLHQQTLLNDKQIITNRSPIKLNGEIVGAVAVFQDITKLKQALEELSSTKDFLKMLETGLEHMSEGVLMVDENAHITKITESYCNFLGLKQEEVIGKHVADVIENTRMHKVVESGVPEIGEIQRMNNKDVIVMRIPIKVKGKVVGVVGQVMFQDVSDLTKLARKLNLMERKLEYYQQEVKRWQRTRYNIHNIIGKSPEITMLKNMIKKVAQYPSTALIRGESGTGKELIAHAIHEAGPRKDGPFIRVNCAAIPKELLEAELFGYEEGSFTGAKKKGKPGKFELAEGGTIFLDEIGDMPAEMQVKLLRVLQEKEVDRVGSTAVRNINVRVIASTNRNLDKMISQGTFRYDLFYRLNVVTLRLPPLREMREDILELTAYFINQLNEELGTRIDRVAHEVKQIFLGYHWPGNVRELRNALERSANVMEGTAIEVKDLPFYLQENEHNWQNNRSGTSVLDDEVGIAEKRAIHHALKRANYNKKMAAGLLNIHRATLYRKLQKYGIEA